MTIEVEIREMKRMLDELNKKLDALLEGRETAAMTFLSHESLKEFLQSEPDFYSAKDLKVAYR